EIHGGNSFALHGNTPLALRAKTVAVSDVWLFACARSINGCTTPVNGRDGRYSLVYRVAWGDRRGRHREGSLVVVLYVNSVPMPSVAVRPRAGGGASPKQSFNESG